MTQQIINLGVADKGNGDVLRTAFTKVNDNFAELYNSVSAVVVVGATAPTAPSVGDLWWNSVSGRMYVYFGTSWVDASPVDGAGISSTNQLVNGAFTASLGTDGELALPANAYTEAVIKELDATALVLFAQKAGANIKLLAGATSAAGAKQWLFNGSTGSLTLPTGGTVSYTPTTATDWNGTAPTTMQAAIDRLAAAFKILNSGTGA